MTVLPATVTVTIQQDCPGFKPDKVYDDVLDAISPDGLCTPSTIGEQIIWQLDGALISTRIEVLVTSLTTKPDDAAESREYYYE